MSSTELTEPDTGTTMISVSGRLTESEVRQSMGHRRNTLIGPTTVYYAGVTAPIISAAMALVSKTAFMKIGLGEVWVYLISSIIAALAGISWYIIFMRWARRQTFGRGGETDFETRFDVSEDAITLTRGVVTTRIPASAVVGVEKRKKCLVVRVSGASDLVIPLNWLDDKIERKALIDRLHQLEETS